MSHSSATLGADSAPRKRSQGYENWDDHDFPKRKKVCGACSRCQWCLWTIYYMHYLCCAWVMGEGTSSSSPPLPAWPQIDMLVAFIKLRRANLYKFNYNLFLAIISCIYVVHIVAEEREQEEKAWIWPRNLQRNDLLHWEWYGENHVHVIWT